MVAVQTIFSHCSRNCTSFLPSRGEGVRMLYETYQWQDDLMAPMRHLARSLGNGHTRSWPVSEATQRHVAAGLEMLANFELTHERPDFDIAAVPVGNREVPVTEEVVLDLPFGKLLHFAKDVDTPQPRVLVVAPLSGHFATLLRGDGGHAAARPRRLHHRLGQRPRRARRRGALRGRRAYRLPDPLPGGDRPRRACAGRLPALRADAGRRRGDVAGPQPGHPALDDADGRADRHAREPDGGEQARQRAPARRGSSAT